MLILGRKYKFTQHELDRLQKKFKNITTVKYTDRAQEDVLAELQKNAQANDFDMLVLNTKATVGDDIIKYLTKLQFEKRNKKVRVMSVEHFMEEYLCKCYIPEDNSDLHFLEDIKPFNPFEYFLKRVIDYSGGTVLLLVSFLLQFKIKARMAQESPGDLYFLQDRVGQNTTNFKCYKFRTMHENSHHDPYTKKEDSRVYPFGMMMRKLRIDELPQYKNILKGEMHLIGPRAEWDILVKNYESQIPYYNERHLVKPGITGWAQVMYPYGANVEDARQKLMYDLYYIKHWSIFLEFKVIFKTILVILSKKGI